MDGGSGPERPESGVGLDLYAGTLTRYYSGQWLTTVQRVAQEVGMPCEIVYASGRPPWLQPEEASSAVRAFCHALSTRWGARFKCFEQPPSWNERADAPYQTEKPDHDGIRSLVMVAAYLERPDLTRPVVPDDEPDPACAEAVQRGYYMGNMAVLECHLFLPGNANYLIVAEDPLGAERFTTSIGILRGALDDVNARAWQASPEVIGSWYERGLIRFGPTQTVVQVEVDSAAGRVRQETTEERTEVYDQIEHNAQYALACLYRLCDFAVARDLPIIVDQ